MRACTVRVFVDGVDVTADCFEVDDEAGYAKVFKRNELNMFYFDGLGQIATETLYGVVTIELLEG